MPFSSVGGSYLHVSSAYLRIFGGNFAQESRNDGTRFQADVTDTLKNTMQMNVDFWKLSKAREN